MNIKETEDKTEEISEYVKFKDDFAKNEVVKRFNNRIALFFPYNGDVVNVNYDVEKEEHDPATRTKYLAHEVFEERVYDGILVAKSHVPDSQIIKIRDNGGIRKYLKLDNTKHYHPTMGDCGAPRYIDEHEPTMTTKELYDYYNDLGFDYGIGLDHIVKESGVTNPSKDSIRRQNITIRNNIEMLEMVKKNKANFYLMGSVQGWNVEAYKKCVQKYADAGFKFIAIGGLAGGGDDMVGEILSAIDPVVKKYNMGIHVLGITREKLLPQYRRYNVITCDSSTHIIRAVVGPHTAYLDDDKKYHAGLVLPGVNRSTRVKKYLDRDDIVKQIGEMESRYDSLVKAELFELERLKLLRNEYKVKKNTIISHVNTKNAPVEVWKDADRKTKEGLLLAESRVMKGFRDFDKGLINQTECENIAIQFLRVFDGFNPKYFENFTKTMRERPWQNCPCRMCVDTGIEITFLRTGELGSRRIFHNLWTYYKQYKATMDRVQIEYDNNTL